MSTPITHTHDGVVITYNEDQNTWEFELRGRDRSAISLTKAKQFIEAQPADKSDKPFEPVAAYHKDYSGFQHGNVTSVALSHYRKKLWFVFDGKKGRYKVDQDEVYLDTPKNNVLISQYEEVEKQLNSLRAKQVDILDKLSKLDL